MCVKNTGRSTTRFFFFLCVCVSGVMNVAIPTMMHARICACLSQDSADSTEEKG